MNKNSLHLFAGMGGGLQGDLLLGNNPIAAVEYVTERQRVLKANLPQLEVYGDVREFSGVGYKGIDRLCGGSPCRGFSQVGDGTGLRHEQSGLWKEMKRIIAEAQPGEVEFENVANLVTTHAADWASILGDMRDLGYYGFYCIMGASHVGLPHKRERVWLLARRVTRKSDAGFRQVHVDKAPTIPCWPTPRVGGRGTRKFVRIVDSKRWKSFCKDGESLYVSAEGEQLLVPDSTIPATLPKGLKLRDDLETTLFMNAARHGALRDDHVMDAAFVCKLMGWDPAWLGESDVELLGPDKATATTGLFVPANREENSRNNLHLAALGDGQVPVVMVNAHNKLAAAFNA